MEDASSGQATGRFVPNRLRAKLKNVSSQLKQLPCGLSFVLGDDNGIQNVHRSFRLPKRCSVATVWRFRKGAVADPVVSDPFFGGNHGLTPITTPRESLAILDGGPLLSGVFACTTIHCARGGFEP